MERLPWESRESICMEERRNADGRTRSMRRWGYYVRLFAWGSSRYPAGHVRCDLRGLRQWRCRHTKWPGHTYAGWRANPGNQHGARHWRLLHVCAWSPNTLANFPLPPNTVSGSPNGAAGASFHIECTPGATAASITADLNSALSQAGWRRWNPQMDNAHGCGTEPNAYWQWSRNGVAVGWDFGGSRLPMWQIAFCSLAYGA